MWTEEKLNEMLTTPSAKLIDDVKKIKGDIMVLGAGGKMGPTLCILAKNAIIIIFPFSFYFNGSYPPLEKGLHFKILTAPSIQPFNTPYFSMACLVYSEHVG